MQSKIVKTKEKIDWYRVEKIITWILTTTLLILSITSIFVDLGWFD